MKNFSTDGASSSTGHQSVFALESDAGVGCVLQTFEIDTSKLFAVLPAIHILSLKVQEGNGFDLALLRLAVDSAISAFPGRAIEGLAILLGNDLAFIHGK